MPGLKVLVLFCVFLGVFWGFSYMYAKNYLRLASALPSSKIKWNCKERTSHNRLKSILSKAQEET